MKTKLLTTIIAVLCTLTSFAQISILHNFDGSSNEGAYPTGSLLNINGVFYGISYNPGVVFKINANGTGFTKLIEFGFDSDGSGPRGSLSYDGTFLYGMTSQGGANSKGIIFKLKPDGTAYSKLLDFAGASTGSYPTGDLLIDGNFLYGMTPSDGTNGYGTIFKIKNDGTGFAKLLDFTTSNGIDPNGSLITDGTYLYGMTNASGLNGGGTIFKIMNDGSGFSVVHNFSTSSDGYYPMGSLMYDGIFFYGMTQYGGTSNFGTIFKIMPDGTNFATIFNFNGTNGKNPYGNVILDGGLLYGMTNKGGTSGTGGTLFSIMPDGSNFLEVADFFNINAYYPQGTPISYAGTLYGMIEQGGVNNKGVIFQSVMATDIAKTKQTLECNIFPNPAQNSLSISSTEKIKNVYCYTSLGQVSDVKFENNTINISSLAKGLYFLNITMENGNKNTQKFIKE